MQTDSFLKKVTFQGVLGAYSHLALKSVFPHADAIACVTFEEAMNRVVTGGADAAMIPVENSQWGRVADVHHLLPESDLYITGEYFHRVRHKLLGLKDSDISDITHVYSHPQALGQCRKTLQNMNLTPVAADDTAGSAKFIKDTGNKHFAAIASDLAADLYDLKILQDDLEDASHNTTRFIIMRPYADGIMPVYDEARDYLTSFIFETRNIPAALYKVMGGFATNAVNMIRLESYIQNGKFISSRFYAEIQGHPDNMSVKNAFDELKFFAQHFKILGVYPASVMRLSE